MLGSRKTREAIQSWTEDRNADSEERRVRGVERERTHVGIGAAHEVAVEDGLAHLGRHDHGLDAVTASNLFRDGACKVLDTKVLHEGAGCRRDLISTLETLDLEGRER